MTAPTPTAHPTPSTPADLTMRARLRAGLLVLGGILTALLLEPVGPLAFYWLPLFTGATYLAAAMASGRRGPLWAPGVIIGIFGLEAALTLSGTVTGVPDAPGELLAVGLGLLTVAVLHRAGFAVDLLGVALTATLLAAFYLGVTKGWISGLFLKPALYGAVLIVWGLWELRPIGHPRTGPLPA